MLAKRLELKCEVRMNFFNETELYEYFKEVIEKATAKELAFLENEIETLRSETYRQISLSFEQRKNETLQALEETLKVEHQKYLSRLEQGLNHKMAQYREELVNTLMQDLFARFQEYQQTSAYTKLLHQSLQSLDFENIERIEVAKIDVAKIMIEKQHLIHGNEQISGGYRAYFKGGKMLLDVTMEAKMQQARNWIYQHASLPIDQTRTEVDA